MLVPAVWKVEGFGCGWGCGGRDFGLETVDGVFWTVDGVGGGEECAVEAAGEVRTFCVEVETC